jgi:hypothetical protein
MTLVRVTDDHIRLGLVGDSKCCPVALAIDDAIGPLLSGIVGMSVIFVHNTRAGTLIGFTKQTDSVAEFRRSFDLAGRNGAHVKPFEFDLDLENLETEL